VSQEKGLTFDLVKVETSNSYVLIKDDGDTNDASSSNSSENVPSDTRQEDKEARLVREKNTFFLECIQIKAGLQSKIEMILKTKSYVYPTKGISVDGICQQVMHSKKEVQAALNDMKAFNIFSSTDPSAAMYGTLSEEMEREVWYVIRRVLSEWDGGNDYAGKGVLKEDMITQIMDRNDGCEDDINEGVLRHCLEKCTLEVAGEYTKLNVDHIARIVAHHVFNMKRAPWEEKKFIQQWHNLMPGVGAAYEPKLDIIRDLALTAKEVSPMDQEAPTSIGLEAKVDDLVYLKYFPRENLPITQDGRFKALFKERRKWKLDHLIPYVEDLVKKSSFKTVQELLVLYAKVAPREEDDEDQVDYYVAK